MLFAPTSRRRGTVLATAVGAVLALGLSLPTAAQTPGPTDAPRIEAGEGSPDDIAEPAPDPDTIACPIPDGSEFIDSWGAARSGGRRHEGVDMIADRGTAIVAAQAGDVHFKQNRLGGNAAWLTSPRPDGGVNKFYYAHLDAFEGDSRTVAEGEVIGYVGSTGNAQGPHLHFETHFGGSVGNPFDATYEACVVPELNALAYLAERAEAAGTVRFTERTTSAPVDTPTAHITHR